VLRSENTVQEFLDSVYVRSHSEETIKTYRNCIKRFEKFCREKFGYSLKEITVRIKDSQHDVYEILRDFVVYLDKQGYKPRTVDLTINASKGLLRYAGIKIYSEDFKQVVRLPRKTKTQEIPLTKDILIRLLRNVSPKLQTVILVAISSGMRIGELVQLTVSDFDFTSNPTRIRIRADTTKTRTQRESFLTTEATKALKDYLERFHKQAEGESNSHLVGKPVFGRTSMSKGKLRDDNSLKYSKVLVSKVLLQKTLENAIKKIPDLSAKNENGKNAIHFHAFRKFFRTTVGNVCGRDFAEAMIGHNFYLDTYYQLPESKKRELYLLAEPHLTLSDFETVEKNIQSLSSRHEALERKIDSLMTYLNKNSIPLSSMSLVCNLLYLSYVH